MYVQCEKIAFFLKYNFFSLFSTLRIPLTLHFILLWVTKSSYTVLFIITFGNRGATWLLMGATGYLPAGCPMGNLSFSGVVKACSLHCWSLRCSWSIACQHGQCSSNYIFISQLHTWLQWIRQTTARRDEKHSSFGIWCHLYWRFDGKKPYLHTKWWMGQFYISKKYLIFFAKVNKQGHVNWYCYRKLHPVT